MNRLFIKFCNAWVTLMECQFYSKKKSFPTSKKLSQQLLQVINHFKFYYTTLSDFYKKNISHE